MNKKHIRKKKMSRNCWNLNYTFLEWMNEHLKVYYHDAKKHIDLTFHKFQYNDQELTEEDIILRLIELSDSVTKHFVYDANHDEKIEEILDLWRIVLPYLWW